MCGFFGLLRLDNRAVDGTLLTRLTNLLRHRGPDDEAYLLANVQAGKAEIYRGRETALGDGLPDVRNASGVADLGIGFRRLAIQDLSTRARQPMISADGRYVLVFNGEIYNFRELRSELEKLGVSFQTESDSEVLLEAFSAWGTECIRKLEGMWGFAIWDRSERALILSRDRFGIKPLYYSESQSFFAFSSEISPLLELHGVSREASPNGVFQYLRFGLTDNRSATMFCDVAQLEARTWKSVSYPSGKGSTTEYWSPPTSTVRAGSPQECEERFRELFLRSMELHLRSDVGVGVALSGGLDSSSILATAHTLRPDRNFSAVGFASADPSISEVRWMCAAATPVGAELSTITPSPTDLATDLGDLVRSQEQPFGSSRIYAQYRVFQKARELRLPVMLGGQGADELLAGYRPYLATRFHDLVREGAWRPACSLARSSLALPRVTLRSFLISLGPHIIPPVLQDLARRAIGEPLMPRWLNETWFRKSGADVSALPSPGYRETLRERLRRALFDLSLPMLLRYEDRNAMRFSIESRVPFLYTPLFEFVLSLPDDALIDDRATTKSVLRGAMRNILPNELIHRKDKIGFETEEARWLNTLALDNSSFDRIRCLLNDPKLPPVPPTPNDFRRWRLLNLAVWADTFDVGFEGRA